MKQLISIRCTRCSPVVAERKVPAELRCIPNAPVQADVDHLWPGLAVHPFHTHREDGTVVNIFRSSHVNGSEEREQIGWVVTHIRSGVIMGALFERKEQALVARQLLGDLPVDWTLSYDELQSPVIMVQMAKILRDCGGVGLGYGGHHTHD